MSSGSMMKVHPSGVRSRYKDGSTDAATEKLRRLPPRRSRFTHRRKKLRMNRGIDTNFNFFNGFLKQGDQKLPQELLPACLL